MKREKEKGEREAERGRRRNEWLEIKRDRKRGGWAHPLIMISLRKTWDLKRVGRQNLKIQNAQH